MKFGGSSLAQPEKIKVMAERAVRAHARGFSVVMTVSAPADVTDDLIALSKTLAAEPAPREYDALLSSGESISAALTAMAINEFGVKAVSLSGAQAGIRTNSKHGAADIISVDPSRILRELKKRRIVVAAGFQGINPAGDVATLGRGGSDFSAVALARALKAGICEFYTDVKGVYTANPAMVPTAGLLKKISYASVLELARSGAEIRQTRAIAYAARHGIPLRLRSSFETSTGTLVGDFRPAAKPEVTGFAIEKTGNSAYIHIVGSRLDSPEIKKALEHAADGSLRIKRISPGKITLRTGFRDGEQWLKTLHKIFIE